MPHIVTPFTRKPRPSEAAEPEPRHRSAGFFDDQDEWHDATDQADPDQQRAEG